jgi:alternate signal-mediated exported protein, CPF_0494 family
MSKQKSNLKHKKKILAVVLAFAMIIAAAGTYAWFTASDNVVNRFESKSLNGALSLFERFTPPIDWKPGQEIIKEVGVANTGETAALVRISLEETLTLLADDGEIFETSNQATSVTAPCIPVTMDPTAYTTASPAFVAITDADLASGSIPAGVTILRSESAADATVVGYAAYFTIAAGEYQSIKLNEGAITIDADGDIVLDTTKFGYRYYSGTVTTTEDWATNPPADPTTSALDTNIALNYLNASITTIADGDWYYNVEDGYFYFVGVIAAGTTSPLMLNTVSLDEGVGNEYGQVTYDLNVKMEAIQNSADALADWVPNSGSTAALYAAMVVYCS